MCDMKSFIPFLKLLCLPPVCYVCCVRIIYFVSDLAVVSQTPITVSIMAYKFIIDNTFQTFTNIY